MKGKQWQTLVTTGGPESIYCPEGKHKRSIEDLLCHFNTTTPTMMQFEIAPMFVAYSYYI